MDENKEPWQMTPEEWCALSDEEQNVLASRSQVEGPPYLYHSNYLGGQYAGAMDRGLPVSDDVLRDPGKWRKIDHLLLRDNWKTNPNIPRLSELMSPESVLRAVEDLRSRRFDRQIAQWGEVFPGLRNKVAEGARRRGEYQLSFKHEWKPEHIEGNTQYAQTSESRALAEFDAVIKGCL